MKYQIRVLRAIGRRKRAVAQVWLFPGTGQIRINDRDVAEFFYNRQTLIRHALEPLKFFQDVRDKIDITAKVRGGGISGQAGAVRLGIARVLLQLDPGKKKELKSIKALTRDPREKERKKYGKKRARKSFQFSKR